MKKFIFGLIIVSTITGCYVEDTEPQKDFNAAPSWLNGVYINKDKTPSIDEVVLCDDGKAYLGGLAQGSYQIHSEGKVDYITLQSNGLFTFTVSNDRQKLLPSDSFTLDWFTKSELKLDSSRNDTCNW